MNKTKMKKIFWSNGHAQTPFFRAGLACLFLLLIISPFSILFSCRWAGISRFRKASSHRQYSRHECLAKGLNNFRWVESTYRNNHTIKVWCRRNPLHLWRGGCQSSDQAVNRVAERVKQGGHFIPEETIIRRYYAGIKNLLKCYLPLADRAYIMDNSSEKYSKRLIARKNINSSIEILDREIWDKLERTAYDWWF